MRSGALSEGSEADTLMKTKKKAKTKINDKRLNLFIGAIFPSFRLNLMISRKERSFLKGFFLLLSIPGILLFSFLTFYSKGKFKYQISFPRFCWLKFSYMFPTEKSWRKYLSIKFIFSNIILITRNRVNFWYWFPWLHKRVENLSYE